MSKGFEVVNKCWMNERVGFGFSYFVDLGIGVRVILRRNYRFFFWGDFELEIGFLSLM